MVSGKERKWHKKSTKFIFITHNSWTPVAKSLYRAQMGPSINAYLCQLVLCIHKFPKDCSKYDGGLGNGCYKWRRFICIYLLINRTDHLNTEIYPHQIPNQACAHMRLNTALTHIQQTLYQSWPLTRMPEQTAQQICNARTLIGVQTPTVAIDYIETR